MGTSLSPGYVANVVAPVWLCHPVHVSQGIPKLTIKLHPPMDAIQPYRGSAIPPKGQFGGSTEKCHPVSDAEASGCPKKAGEGRGDGFDQDKPTRTGTRTITATGPGRRLLPRGDEQ